MHRTSRVGWQDKHLSAFHPKRLGRIEMMRFVRAGVEFRQHIRTDALHLRRVVRAIARSFVQRARVRASVGKHVSSPGLIVMQPNHTMANRTFRIKRVKPPSPQQLYKFNKPYGQTHGYLPLVSSHQLECSCVPVLWRLTPMDRKDYAFPRQPAVQS